MGIERIEIGEGRRWRTSEGMTQKDQIVFESSIGLRFAAYQAYLRGWSTSTKRSALGEDVYRHGVP